MDIKKELEFLRYISQGLFNNKYVRFEIRVKSHSKGGRHVTINLRDIRYTKVGNNIDLEISYLTSEDTVYIRQETAKEVHKSEAVPFIESLLALKKEEYGSEYSTEPDGSDFYNTLEQLADLLFLSNERFELNVWRGTSLHLRKTLGLEYGELEEAIHINGGAGTAKHQLELESMTTTIEFGKSPKDGKYYLEVFNDIVENAETPQGLYPDATIDKLTSTVVEQYQKAWNRK